MKGQGLYAPALVFFGLALRLGLAPSFLLAERGSRLVDLLVAVGRVLRAYLYGSAVVLEIEVVSLETVLKDPDLVLGVTGVVTP
jgi:hypothetical protein